MAARLLFSLPFPPRRARRRSGDVSMLNDQHSGKDVITAPEHSFPDKVETPRLRVDRYGSDDAAQIFAIVDRNRDRLLQDFPDMARDLGSIGDAKKFVVSKGEEWSAGRRFCYGIWPRSPGELLGQIQVKNIVWNVPSAELSYFIDSSCERQGFATEAIIAMLGVAFHRFRFQRVYVRVLPSNEGSIKLAGRLGFQYEGQHRSEYRCGHGKLHDVRYFSLTFDDYQRRGNRLGAVEA